MTAPDVKGWCPGAYRPMMSGDGYVVRVRPFLGQVTAVQARGIAMLAAAHGSGAIDVTNRANIQLRGVTEESHAKVIAGLADLGLLDDDPAAESHRNIVYAPFRSVEVGKLIIFIGTALADGLTAAEFASLPGKFGFVVDPDPSARQLDGVSGDIRIEGSDAGLLVRLDGRDTGVLVPDAERAVALALDIVRWFLASGGVGADGRGRMRRHLAAGSDLPKAFYGSLSPAAATDTPTFGAFGGGTCVGAAFGQFTADGFRALANGLPDDAIIRVTPYRMVFVPDVAPSHIPVHADLIVDAASPLQRVVACSGAPWCPQASVATRSLARGLARAVPETEIWHISGCAKGCALPDAAPVTLVGRDGSFDLVRNGAPWDDPCQSGLGPDETMNLLGR